LASSSKAWRWPIFLLCFAIFLCISTGFSLAQPFSAGLNARLLLLYGLPLLSLDFFQLEAMQLDQPSALASAAFFALFLRLLF